MNNIKVSNEHLQLIQKALELYMRCSIGQFERIADVSSIQEWMWKEENREWNKDHLIQLLKTASGHYTGVSNGSYGVYNKNLDPNVQDTMNIHDQIRHHLWKKGDQKFKHTVDARDAMVKLIEIK